MQRVPLPGLAIHGSRDWSAPHPVIRLDFGGGEYRSRDGISNSVDAQLDAIERAAGVQPRHKTRRSGSAT